MGKRVIGPNFRVVRRWTCSSRLATSLAVGLAALGCSENVLGLRGVRTSKTDHAAEERARNSAGIPTTDAFSEVISGLGLRGPVNAGAVPRPPVLMVLGRPTFEFLGYLLPARHPQAIFEPTSPLSHCEPGADNLFCRGVGKTYGGASPSSARSACNVAATEPPVVVDQNGRYYGRFSVSDGIAGHPDSVCAPQGAFASRDGCYLVKWVCSVPETPEGGTPSP